jgi:general stress protein YciG
LVICFVKDGFNGMEESAKGKRGFASMDPERRREIARMGGMSVPPEKRSFSQNAGLAVRAGRKGGQSVGPADRSFARDPSLAAKAGAKGGRASHQARGLAE